MVFRCATRVESPEANGSVMVEVCDLHKTYHIGEVDVPAVRGVSLTIERGEFLAIMGQSGSGKSTLMHMMGCLDRCDRGRLLLDRVDVTRLSRRELARVRHRKIGFVFQSFNLLGRTTVLDNIAMPLAYGGTSRRERRCQAAAVLDRVSLGHRANHHSNQLSGGEQQRVAIARSLVMKPILLLADEPTGNLDTRTGKEIMALLKELNHDSGLTIGLVTHEADIASHARRTITMKDGRITSDTVSQSATA